ncbi:hypothetical protein MMC13_006164 [Lambiella insularis]|nr:hypothetical protein [Lambiella insularis]
MNRMPRGITVGTCSLAIDVGSTTGDTAIASWATLHLDMYKLIDACVSTDHRGQGGTSTPEYGFVFTVVNPYLVSIANTCMATQGPRRMDVVQCVLGIAAGAQQAANIPLPPSATSSQAANMPLPPPDTSAAEQQQLNDASPLTEDDIDLLGLYFPEAGHEGAEASNAGPRGAGSSSARPSPMGLLAASTRLLPAPPQGTMRTKQLLRIGSNNKQHFLAGTWVLRPYGWTDGRNTRIWRVTGSWYLVLGMGRPAPFPGGAVPAWEGGAVRITKGHNSYPISEAWIAENGRWEQIEGLVPPEGTWLENGGWLLCRGADSNSRAALTEGGNDDSN